jgi:hypothetical protein
MLTTLGRTGSTLLAQLLRAHPRVVVHGRFPYETRVGRYWMSVLRALASPASYVQVVVPSADDQFWWLGDPGLAVHAHLAGDPLVEWLGGADVDALARFCRERIAASYAEVAATQGRSDAAYFAEKHLPEPFVQDRLWELIPDSREVVLVRDPRDMIASILAFNHKRGVVAFGRQLAASDEEFVLGVRDAVEALRHAWRRRGSRALLVRYEDLVLRAPETLRTVFAYLDLEHGQGTVDDVLRLATETAPELQDSHRTAGAPEASVGRWRRDLSPALQDASGEAFAPALADFGYTR